MISLFILFGTFITFTFQSVDVYYYRMLNIFHFGECFNQRLYIVTVIYIYIVQSHRLEEVTFALTVTVTQFFQIPV